MKWTPLALVFATVLLPCRAAERELRTVAEIRGLGNVTFNAEPPLALTGVVTWVHPGRNLFVIQDDTGAVAIHPDTGGIAVKPGQRVALKAAGSAPFVANCPGFPFSPSEKAVLNSFEIPASEGDYRLTRMRGWLRPPVTGEYTFWIASDDSSELWLSATRHPHAVNRVAQVPPGMWTLPHEWLRFASQRSERVHLRAGESYYIEAFQEQAQAGSHLAVAWEGPGSKLAVIDGQHLVPWGAPPGAPAGILRECWNDYSVAKVGALTSGSMAGGELAVRGLEITVLDDGGFPPARPLDPALDLQPDDAFRWVEAGGEIRFVASDGESVTLEIASEAGLFPLRVAGWQGPLPSPGRHARFRGVLEAGRDAGGRLIASSVWTPSPREVSISAASGESPPSPAVADLRSPSPTAVMGGGYFTRGVVTFSGDVLGKPCLVVQETLGGIFVSQEERKPHPPLFVGHSVEIGGGLLRRKFSPAILPLTLNILGWLNLPVPVKPTAESDYRDGLWTELEGVVRGVDPDGTVMIMGKQATIRMWIGNADRSSREALVDTVLRVRGVMSLETFDGPLLLVPSRGFVEIREPAPGLPAEPTAIAELHQTADRDGWRHRVKVAGTVTHERDGVFFLQDETGAARVIASGVLPVHPGASVTVTGFPEVADRGIRISAASWQPLADRRPVTPVRWDPGHAAPSLHGRLVTLEAQLLSRLQRGADRLLEVQAGGQIVEAVLHGPAMPDLSPGSRLEITGVGWFDPATAHHGSPRLQLLMRSPRDVELLEGPPWWTWQRTAALVGLLLAVLAGALLRIHFLNRRFARQQAARLAFTRAMLESQESERRRIAASLHDSLGQELLVIRNQAHLALQSAPESLRHRLEEISGTTLQAIEEVREITRNLRPYQLDRLGLTQAIRALTRKVSENGPVALASHVDDVDGLLDGESEIHLYRIVQEGLNNVLKHSGATEAAVVVKKVPDGLSISIRDNGRGMPAAATPGFGLSGIKERAEILGGSARTDSAPGHGVNLQVQLPLPSPCATASES